MIRTATAALAFTVVLGSWAQAQSLAGPRLHVFPSLTGSEVLSPPPVAALNEARRQYTTARRGGTLLAYTGLGLVIGAATGALVGPVLTNSACLAWKKDAANQTTCLDAFFTPREHVRSTFILAGIGGLIGAVSGLVARGGP